MHWFSTALLIALTAGTVGWTGWLLRRLFVVPPAEPGSRQTGSRQTDSRQTDSRQTEDEKVEEPTA